MTLGNRISTLRKDKKLSQEFLATGQITEDVESDPIPEQPAPPKQEGQ